MQRPELPADLLHVLIHLLDLLCLGHQALIRHVLGFGEFAALVPGAIKELVNSPHEFMKLRHDLTALLGGYQCRCEARARSLLSPHFRRCAAAGPGGGLWRRRPLVGYIGAPMVSSSGLPVGPRPSTSRHAGVFFFVSIPPPCIPREK